MPTRQAFHDSSSRVLHVQELAVRVAQGFDQRARHVQMKWRRYADNSPFERPYASYSWVPTTEMSSRDGANP